MRCWEVLLTPSGWPVTEHRGHAFIPECSVRFTESTPLPLSVKQECERGERKGTVVVTITALQRSEGFRPTLSRPGKRCSTTFLVPEKVRRTKAGEGGEKKASRKVFVAAPSPPALSPLGLARVPQRRLGPGRSVTSCTRHTGPPLLRSVRRGGRRGSW